MHVPEGEVGVVVGARRDGRRACLVKATATGPVEPGQR